MQKLTIVGNADDPNRIVLTGHSHRHALYVAWANKNSRFDPGTLPKAVCMILTEQPGEANHDKDYWDRVIYEATNQIVVLSWRGNQHNRFLLNGNSGFAVLPLGVQSNTLSNVSYIPFSMAVSYFEANMDNVGASLLDILSRLHVAKRVFVIGTPPPKRDDRVREGIEFREQGYIPKGMKAAELPITPLSTRVGLWQALQASVVTVCRRAGIAFIPVPKIAWGPDGSLLDDYAIGDATHGNDLFGALMWKEVLLRM